MENGTGTHIIGDLKMCDQNYLFGLDMEAIKKKSIEIIQKNSFTVLGSYFHRFENNSFTGIIALSESHVSMHTWPELGIVNIDVYVCNYNHDNTEATRRTFEEISALFHSEKVEKREIKR
jgi:S-adenosylmethionine decarboxylase proenzyme